MRQRAAERGAWHAPRFALGKFRPPSLPPTLVTRPALQDLDLSFSTMESRDLLAGFGVELSVAELALLHQRSEGWAAALQMAALSLRSARDRRGPPGRCR